MSLISTFQTHKQFQRTDSQKNQTQRKRKERDDEFSLDGTPKKYNTTSLAGTALGCDGAGISSRKAARICNLYAKDIGYLTWENCHTHSLDASKLDKWRRERAKQTALEEKD